MTRPTHYAAAVAFIIGLVLAAYAGLASVMPLPRWW